MYVYMEARVVYVSASESHDSHASVVPSLLCAVDMEQLGIIFYDFLFQTAPAMQSLFVKPKHLLGQVLC